ARAGCLNAIVREYGGRVALVDFARFEGRPALVVALDDAPLGGGKRLVVVVGPACGQGNAVTDERYRSTVGGCSTRGTAAGESRVPRMTFVGAKVKNIEESTRGRRPQPDSRGLWSGWLHRGHLCSSCQSQAARRGGCDLGRGADDHDRGGELPGLPGRHPRP